jgi:hypothetical protein
MNFFKKKPQDVPVGLKYLIERMGEEKASTVKAEKEVDEHLDKSLALLKDGTVLERKFGLLLNGKDIR